MVDDFVDITPPMIGQKTSSKGVVFQENEWAQINDNPRGLTKEGIEKSIELWNNSNNGHVVLKFKTMLARCKMIEPSGKTDKGLVIYARAKDGTASWVESEVMKKASEALEKTKPKNKK